MSLIIATFQHERWKDCETDIRGLVDAHWREIALDQDRIPLDIDFEMYRRLDAETFTLHVTTARERGNLIGYYVNVIRPHPHYKTSLFAFLDAYFILPAYRQGPLGVQLFQAMEREMRKCGVKSLISISKNHHNVLPLFERLGWKAVGITCQKWIGPEPYTA